MRAALIYQRATSDADQRIADKLSELVAEHRGGKSHKKKIKKGRKSGDEDGSAGVAVPVG